jgi:protein phosphatase
MAGGFGVLELLSVVHTEPAVTGELMGATERQEQDLLEVAAAGKPWRWGSASDVGKVREANEDALAIEPEVGLFLVSDGMGGHRGGALASQIVVTDLPPMIEVRLSKLRGTGPRAIRRLLARAIREQNKHMYMEGDSESGYKGMGATVALVLLKDVRAYVANAGDSRVYRLRRGRLVQVNRDHSVVAELIEEGRIRPEEAEGHDAEGQITQYMGMDEKAEPHVCSFALKKADRLLLCTDGLTDMVGERGIARILRREDEPQAACDLLIQAANRGGGFDNVTVVVVDWLGG